MIFAQSMIFGKKCSLPLATMSHMIIMNKKIMLRTVEKKIIIKVSKLTAVTDTMDCQRELP